MSIVRVVVAALMVGLSFSSFANSKPEDVAQSWLKAIDSGAFQDALSLAGSEFSVDKGTFLAAQAKERESFGPVESHRRIDVKDVPKFTSHYGPKYSLVAYASSYKKKPEVFQVITLAEEGGAWRVVSTYTRH